MRRAAVLGLCWLLAAVPDPGRPAAASPEVATFVAEIGDAAVHLLRDGIVDPVQRRAEVSRLLGEGFDMPGLARQSLGRFWRVASEPQRAEFEQLFAAFLINLYANSLDRSPEDPPVVVGFDIDKVRAEPPQDYVVLTHFDQPAGLPFRVEWRVRGNGPGYRVLDVSVEGISMVVLFRQMLAGAVQQGGGDVEGLLARLRDVTGEPAPVSAAETVE